MRIVIAGVIGVGSALMAWGLRPVGAQEDASKPEFYTTKVVPIFQANCYKCHAGMFHRGGLNMKTREGMVQGGHHGTALIPGDPAKSLLVKLMRHEGQGQGQDSMPMPPKVGRLSEADISVVERWVKAGAIVPKP
jgi:cytochrome c